MKEKRFTNKKKRNNYTKRDIYRKTKKKMMGGSKIHPIIQAAVAPAAAQNDLQYKQLCLYNKYSSLWWDTMHDRYSETRSFHTNKNLHSI